MLDFRAHRRVGVLERAAHTRPNTPILKRNQGGMLMKAMVYTTYGSPDVLQLTQVAKPMLKEDEVLIRIHAASANAAGLNP